MRLTGKTKLASRPMAFPPRTCAPNCSTWRVLPLFHLLSLCGSSKVLPKTDLWKTHTKKKREKKSTQHKWRRDWKNREEILTLSARKGQEGWNSRDLELSIYLQTDNMKKHTTVTQSNLKNQNCQLAFHKCIWRYSKCEAQDHSWRSWCSRTLAACTLVSDILVPLSE